MEPRKLEQHEFEDLSAWRDGELDEPRAGEIARLVATDADWAVANRRLDALDEALDAWTAPQTPDGLADRIIRGVSEQAAETTRRPRLIRLATPIAAAAAAVILVTAAVIVLTGDGEKVAVDEGEPTAPQIAQADGDDGEDAAGQPGSQIVEAHLEGIPQRDRFVVENLDLFRNYDVVANLETIEALHSLESDTTGI